MRYRGSAVLNYSADLSFATSALHCSLYNLFSSQPKTLNLLLAVGYKYVLLCLLYFRCWPKWPTPWSTSSNWTPSPPTALDTRWVGRSLDPPLSHRQGKHCIVLILPGLCHRADHHRGPKRISGGQIKKPPVEATAWCYTGSREDTNFSFAWTIENFGRKMENYKNGECLTSDTFRVSLSDVNY